MRGMADDTRIHIRLTPGDDDDLIARVTELRTNGQSVQDAVKAVLRRGGFVSGETLAEQVRMVLREELARLNLSAGAAPEPLVVNDEWIDGFEELMIGDEENGI